MTPDRKLEIATRYVAGLQRHWLIIALASVVLLAGSAWLIAFRLPLHADFSHLLPPDAPAVRDLRRLEARVAAQDAMLVLVVSKDPAARAAAAADMAARARKIDPQPGHPGRGRRRGHPRLPARPPPPLRAARGSRGRARRPELAHRAGQARGQPAVHRLDEEGDAADAAATAARLEELRQRRDEAERRLDRSSFVSADGETQLIIVRTAFPKTDVEASRRALRRRSGASARTSSPGTPASTSASPAATWSRWPSTTRSSAASCCRAWSPPSWSASCCCSTSAASASWWRWAGCWWWRPRCRSALAALTVGHLNAATAFLGAIIAGNGVNYGILLIARYLEERRQHEPTPAMARAIVGDRAADAGRVAGRGDRLRLAGGDQLPRLRRLRDHRRARHDRVLGGDATRSCRRWCCAWCRARACAGARR